MEVTIDCIDGLVYFLLSVFGAGIVILVDNLRRSLKGAGDDVKRR